MDDGADLINEAFAAADAAEARRLRQQEGLDFETIGKRLGLEPAEVYSAVSGKTGDQVEAWRPSTPKRGADG